EREFLRDGDGAGFFSACRGQRQFRMPEGEPTRPKSKPETYCDLRQLGCEPLNDGFPAAVHMTRHEQMSNDEVGMGARPTKILAHDPRVIGNSRQALGALVV